MKMTNKEIIEMAVAMSGTDFEYNGENLKTFAAWKAAGYSVKKGEKAFIKTQLWAPIEKKDKDGKKETKLYMKNAALFTANQVKPMEKKQKAGA